MNSKEIYKKWLNSRSLTKEEKKILLKMNENEINNFFNPNGLKFGTAGVRATIGLGTSQLNKFVYSQLTEAYCKWLLKKKSKPKIIISRDNRENGSFYQKICSEVATSLGVKVFIISKNRIKATPIISFLIKEMKMDGAIIITASHNPKNYNGFKIYKDTGGQLINKETNLVQRLMPLSEKIIDKKYIKNKNLIFQISKKTEEKYWKEAKKALIKTKTQEDKTFPIVFSPHHGTAVNEMEKWLKYLGYKNIILVNEQNFIDSKFTNSPNPNPEDIKSFYLSLKYAKKSNSEIMIASDPDSDRLAISVLHKKKWHYLSGNEAGIIFTEYVLSNKKFNKKPMVISTHVSTPLTEIICKKNNIDFFKTGTGFKWLSEKINLEIKNHDLVVAFEEAIGSLNSTINSDKDAFQAAGLILEIFYECKKNKLTLIDFLENIYRKYIYWCGETIFFELDIKKNLDWKTKMELKMDFFKNLNPKKIGNEKFLKSSWNIEGNCLEWFFTNKNIIKFRMSGTEPKFKCYINSFGKSKKEAMVFLKKSKEYILSLYNN